VHPARPLARGSGGHWPRLGGRNGVSVAGGRPRRAV